jgi:hypothetical protein
MLRVQNPNQSPLNPQLIEEIAKKFSEAMKQSGPFDIWLQRAGAWVGVLGGIAAVLAAYHAAVAQLPEISLKLSNLENDNKEFKKLSADNNKEYNRRFDTVIALSFGVPLSASLVVIAITLVQMAQSKEKRG